MDTELMIRYGVPHRYNVFTQDICQCEQSLSNANAAKCVSPKDLLDWKTKENVLNQTVTKKQLSSKNYFKQL